MRLDIIILHFVKSYLEYASLIWYSNNIYVTQNLEIVQNQFLHFLSFKFKIEWVRHSGYDDVLLYFNIKSLSETRNYLHYELLLKLLNNLIDYPYLFERLNFKINFKFIRDRTIL